jgi:hypothetical protein
LTDQERATLNAFLGQIDTDEPPRVTLSEQIAVIIGALRIGIVPILWRVIGVLF